MEMLPKIAAWFLMIGLGIMGVALAGSLLACLLITLADCVRGVYQDKFGGGHGA